MFQSGFICVILTEKMHDLWQWRGKMQQNRVFCAMTGFEEETARDVQKLQSVSR